MLPPTAESLFDALVFYDRMRAEYTARTSFGMAVAYLARKHPQLSFLAAEKALRAALDERPLAR